DDHCPFFHHMHTPPFFHLYLMIHLLFISFHAATKASAQIPGAAGDSVCYKMLPPAPYIAVDRGLSATRAPASFPQSRNRRRCRSSAIKVLRVSAAEALL